MIDFRNRLERNTGNGLFSFGDKAFVIVAGLLYYTLIRQYARVLEDFGYSLAFRHDMDRVHYVTSFGEVLQSQMYEYTHTTGRFLVHSIVQYLCAIPSGREIFFVVSTAMFMLLLVGLIRLSRLTVFSGVDKYFLLFFLVLLVPVPGRTFLGHISFVVNYLWPSALLIWLGIFFVEKRKKKVGKLKNASLFLYALVCGSLQESFSVPLMGALCLYCLMNWRNLKDCNACLLVGFVVGASLCIFAPANFNRYETADYLTSSNVTGLRKYWFSVRMILETCRVVVVLLGVLSLLFLCKRAYLKRHIIDNKYYYTAILISLLFAVFVAFAAAHQLTIVGVLSALLLTRMVHDLWNVWIAKRAIGLRIVIVTLFALWYIPVHSERSEMVDAWNEFMDSAQHNSDGTAVATRLYTWVNEEEDSPWVDYTNFVMVEHSLGSPTLWGFMSLYFTKGLGLHELNLVLPYSQETIVALCNDENERGENLFFLDGCKSYVVRLPESANVENVSIHFASRYGWWTKTKLAVNRLLHRDAEDSFTIPLDEKRPFFLYKGFRYFIYRDMKYETFEVLVD